MSDKIKLEENFINKLLDELDLEVYGIINNSNLMAYYDKVKAYHEISPTEFCDYEVDKRLMLDTVLDGAKSAIVIAIPYNLINNIKTDVKGSDISELNNITLKDTVLKDTVLKDIALKDTVLKDTVLKDISHSTPYGTISNSAWEFDYHNIVRALLEEVLTSIKGYVNEQLNKNFEPGKNCTEIRQSGFKLEGAIAVDTSPLVDRILAMEAGLGHYGKNTCIINNRYGTAFYIGTLILNVDIIKEVKSNQLHEKGYNYEDGQQVGIYPHGQNEDQYEKILCKSCLKCVELCPGNALSGDYTMNVNRCISYLTQKKELTFDEMKKIGSRVYGCDICQAVCPYNTKMNNMSTTDPRFTRTTSNRLDLINILSMSNKEVQRTFKSSGFIWRGPKIIKRNCMIVLGNLKSPSGFEFILNNMEKFNEELAMTALWSLFAIDQHKAIDYLETKGKIYEEKFSDYIKILISYFTV